MVYFGKNNIGQFVKFLYYNSSTEKATNGIQGYKNRRIQKYKDTRIQGNDAKWMQGCKNTRTYGIKGYKDKRVQG